MDIERIFIAGSSAGGMIAVNMCFRDELSKESIDLTGVLAIVNLWGTPNELNLNIRSDSLPIIIVHGTEDEVVNIKNSIRFVKKLEQASSSHIFIPLEGENHNPVALIDRIDLEIESFLHGILIR